MARENPQRLPIVRFLRAKKENLDFLEGKLVDLGLLFSALFLSSIVGMVVSSFLYPSAVVGFLICTINGLVGAMRTQRLLMKPIEPPLPDSVLLSGVVQVLGIPVHVERTPGYVVRYYEKHDDTGKAEYLRVIDRLVDEKWVTDVTKGNGPLAFSEIAEISSVQSARNALPSYQFVRWGE